MDLAVRQHRMGRFPDLVVFIELADQIRVIAVAHERRRPGYWQTRARD